MVSTIWPMEYISVMQFAEKYGISERTARNYCANGKIDGAFHEEREKTYERRGFEGTEIRAVQGTVGIKWGI